MAQTTGSNKFEKWELPETMATLVTKQNANLEKIDKAIIKPVSRQLWGDTSVISLSEIGTINTFNTGFVVNDAARIATLSIRTTITKSSSDVDRHATLLTINNYRPVMNIQGECLINRLLFSVQAGGRVMVYNLANGDNEIRIYATYQY